MLKKAQVSLFYIVCLKRQVYITLVIGFFSKYSHQFTDIYF